MKLSAAILFASVSGFGVFRKPSKDSRFGPSAIDDRLARHSLHRLNRMVEFSPEIVDKWFHEPQTAEAAQKQMEIAEHEKVLIGKLYWLKNESADLAQKRKEFVIMQQRPSHALPGGYQRAFRTHENQDRIQLTNKSLYCHLVFILVNQSQESF